MEHLPINFVERFKSAQRYKEWLEEQDIKIVSVIVFSGELVVTYTIR